MAAAVLRALGLVLALAAGGPGRGTCRAEPGPRSSSVVLDAAAGQLRVVQGWEPAAVAWANLTDHIQHVG